MAQAQPMQSEDSYTSLMPASVAEETSRLDRHGYLFGQKLTNSWSPFLHSVIYEHLGLKWGQVRLDSDDIPLFLKLVQNPNFYGMSSMRSL